MTRAATAPVLHFDNASIGYEGRAVVRALDLRIDAGEVVAVLGTNGSGKSTLVRGLFGLAQLLDGTIQVLGTDRDQFREWRRIGYVPQAQLHAGAMPTTVREMVASGRLAHLRPWQRFGRLDQEAVAAAIDAVGLADRTRTPVAKLSGGQQRRVLIARALAGQPEVMVLDEPTAGVDAPSQEALAGILAELCSRGLTVVLVAHELGPVAPLVTRVVVMHHGEVAFDGPPGEAPPSAGGDWHHDHGHQPPGRPSVLPIGDR